MVASRFSAIFLPISSGFTTQQPCSDFPSHLYMCNKAHPRPLDNRLDELLPWNWTPAGSAQAEAA